MHPYEKVRFQKRMRRESKKNVFTHFREYQFEDGEQKFRWMLSGHGEKYEHCGKVNVIGCTNFHSHQGHKGKGTLAKQSCKRLGCPVCYESAASSRALVVLAKFMTFRYGKQEAERRIFEIKYENRFDGKSNIKQHLVEKMEQWIQLRNFQVKHIIASPPQDSSWSTAKEFTANRRKAYSLMKTCGVQGGVVVPHPYRLKCADCGHHPIPDHRKECPNCHSDRFVWYYSPHFHVIGYGFVTGTKKNYDLSGWVIKNLGVRESVYSTVQYILSHAGIAKGVLTLSWFGTMATRSTGASAKIGTIKQLCPECGEAYHLLEWAHTDRGPPKHKFKLSGKNAFTFEYADYRSKRRI